jgi:fatty-acyl-CoA synthase
MDCPGVLDAATYGVTVPGAGGRPWRSWWRTGVSISKLLAERMSRRIPVYALPVFVRLYGTLDVTETFERQKQRLIRDKFDPSVGDPLLLRYPTTGDYRPIDRAFYTRIAVSEIRF